MRREPSIVCLRFRGRPADSASTSSKTSVRPCVAPCAHVLTARAIRDNSPPDAILSIGRGISPALADTRNCTASIPVADHEVSSTEPGRRLVPLQAIGSPSATRLPSSFAARTPPRTTPVRPIGTRALSCFCLLSIRVRCSDAFSVASRFPVTSDRKRRISATDPPYLRFNLSMAARRVSTSSSREDPPPVPRGNLEVRPQLHRWQFRPA